MPPKIEDHLKRYYILGYFDGDGGIAFHNVKSRKNTLQAGISFTSTSEVCEWIADFFRKDGIYVYKGKRMKNGTNNYTITINGNRQCVLALRKIYGNSNFNSYLKRKYDRYMVLEERFKMSRFYVFKREGRKWLYTFQYRKQKFYKERFPSEDEAALACFEKMKSLGYEDGIKKLVLGRERLFTN